jgi:hypothetical protein
MNNIFVNSLLESHNLIVISVAFGSGKFDINVVRSTLATNFYGTLNVCNHLYPLIRPNGRLINVSSMVGKLNTLSSEFQKEFSREDLDIDGLIGLMKKFENDVENNQWNKEGWPTRGKLSGRRYKNI